MELVTGDKYLDSLVRFIHTQTGPLIESTITLKLNPIGLHYLQTRLESLSELEALLANAPVDYLRAYVSDLGDHRALEGVRRILRLLSSVKVVSVLDGALRDPTPVNLAMFGRLKVLELRGCDLSTSAAKGLLELRHTLEKLICHNSTDALRHVFASRIAEIKDCPVWNRLSFVSCACNGLLLMDESMQLLPVVETLDLSRNKFAKVDNLRKCTRLKHLDIGFNQLRTVASFREVSTYLVKLVLRNNALTTLRGIENLKCLEGLDISYNIVSNFSELEVLSRFPSLLNLWLEGNPICCARWYRSQVFSIFLYPDKLMLDGSKISTREFWKVQIITASRQKQPASFGFYSPAKGDTKLERTTNTKRKKHSRLACIEREEQGTHSNSDNESVGCENEAHSKVEDIIISDEEKTEMVDFVERIERMKKERSDLWLHEFKKWLIQDSSTDNNHMTDFIPDKENPGGETGERNLGESSRYVSNAVQASVEENSANVLESDSSFADSSFVNSRDHYGGISVASNFSMGNNTSGNFGERKPRETPYYQDDILHRRRNLVEEYLQLSAESFSVASSDSNTSCGEDGDFTEYGPSIPDTDMAVIEELSERSSYSKLHHHREDLNYQKVNEVSQIAENGVGTSYRKSRRRVIALEGESNDILGKTEQELSSNGDVNVCVNKSKDKQPKPVHHVAETCDMGIISDADVVRRFCGSKSSSLDRENVIEKYFNTEFVDKEVGETCEQCIMYNCIVGQTKGYKEREVAVLLSSNCKFYILLVNTNDESEISVSSMGCHRIEDIKLVLVGLGLQFLRIYIENGGTYMLISRCIDKSRQLLHLLQCLDSERRTQLCCTKSVEQVQVEFFQRDICGCLDLCIYQYAMVLFWCSDMEEDIQLSRSLFMLEYHLLVCTEDFMKCGSLTADTPYFAPHSCCSISDVSEMVIDTIAGWNVTLTIENTTTEFCALEKMEKKTRDLRPLEWKLEWFSERSLFNFVALLKAIHAGVPNSPPFPLPVRCVS